MRAARKSPRVVTRNVMLCGTTGSATEDKDRLVLRSFGAVALAESVLTGSAAKHGCDRRGAVVTARTGSESKSAHVAAFSSRRRRMCLAMASALSGVCAGV